jgi:hypothetical protein
MKKINPDAECHTTETPETMEESLRSITAIR